MIVSGLAFMCVTAIVAMVAFIFGGTDTNKTSERLDTLTGKRKKENEAASILRKTALEQDAKSLLSWFVPTMPSLNKIFVQADCNITPSTLFGVGLLLAILTMSGLWLYGVKWYFLPPAGMLMFCVPLAWLFNKRRARLKKFSGQLSDALELVARALRAGHSLAAGMHVVAEEMPAPIAEEFNRVYEEQNLGIPIEEAMRSMCDRVPNLDLRFFVTSVLVQRQTGGDLSEILDKIGYVIRERFRILGQVQALTAEGRLSGVILVALPFGLLLMMLYIKPDYVEKLWTHELGIKMSVVALIAQIVGALVIKKIVNIKV
jgi:tight adherence protein B